ncbi:hypothetical protein RHSIM_RhsimUnG0077600 [Rhododendron simsii]|uniref:Uncharacterized protein n=1 Tax=Rhododendron simsii TaxID=118357 RepID=A0A834L599_RHOSS|nr:hypothetical protein RHSIM_RhsimUnG0077600 [Rhododendron simsii]
MAQNEFKLERVINGDDSISFTLRIAQSCCHAWNIHFVFYLARDTAKSIAGELVDQLDLSNEDLTFIAESERVSGEAISKEHDSTSYVNKETSEISFPCSSLSNDVSSLSLSTQSVADGDQRDELKLELDAIDIQYRHFP